MDMYTACEEAFKNGYEKGIAEAKDKNTNRLFNIPSSAYSCIILTENVNGERRMILSQSPFDLWENWNKDADMCPENDAPVHLFILNDEIICADDGWDFEDVMDRIQHLLCGDSIWQ